MGDAIRGGDLTGNWVSLALQAEGAEAMRQLSLGELDLSKLTSVVIGRDPESFLPLNHPTVSFRHALISKQDGSLVIRDLGSTNGTFVNGQRVSQVPLKSGDVVQIGPFKLTYDASNRVWHSRWDSDTGSMPCVLAVKWAITGPPGEPSSIKLAQLHAMVFTTNPASAHVLEKCGFKREAT